MLENPTQSPAAPAAPDSAPVVVKRYAPPNQRSRLNRRKSGGWRAAMHSYNDTSIDLSERPVLYTSGTSAWSQFRLPHQMMAPTNNIGPLPGMQMDFLAELHRKMNNADSSFDN